MWAWAWRKDCESGWGYSLVGKDRHWLLVMATFGHPKILLLDEHTANLDPKTGEKNYGAY